jgi:predicted  nucleic acid-binding Zn-ribbon protein
LSDIRATELGAGEIGRTLLEIQELDTRLFSLERQIETLADKHRLDELKSRIEATRAELGNKEIELEELKSRQLKLDGELDLLTVKVKKEEEKLFSGTIMNPKELSAIQAEILSLRKKRDEMETQDLEEMEDIDRLRSDVGSGGESLVNVEAEERDAIAAYQKERAEEEEEVKVLEAERDELKSRLDPETVSMYEDLLSKRGRQAVVRIEKGMTCGGCHIEFSRTQIDRFQHEDEVFRCEFCRRILVK